MLAPRHPQLWNQVLRLAHGPFNPSMRQALNPSALQPFNPSTLQAFNPSTLQVMRASCTSLGSSYRGPQSAIFRFLKLFLPRTRV
jgi:hypothetical protein